MKAKKLLPVLALALAATTFAACGDKTVVFGPYWNYDSLNEETIYEQASYLVSSKSTKSGYTNYTVEYSGTFTTTLEYNPTESVYTFATDLSVTATFTLGEDTASKTDTAKTSVTFKKANEDLRPVSAHKEMVSHTPRSGDFKKVDDCYVKVSYNYDVTYHETKAKGSIVGSYTVPDKKDATKTKTIAIKDGFSFDKDYTFIDNEQILVAVRAFSSDASSATLESYSAFTEATEKVKFSFKDAEDKATETFDYTLIGTDGNPVKAPRDILCRTAKVVLDKKNSGGTQVIKFAKGKDPRNNAYRNLILKVTTPLAYTMGEIYYTLDTVSYYKA